MPQFPSLPDVAHLSDLLVRFPKNVEPLLVYVNAVLRSDGALTMGERELIASYVSGLNACRFCHGSHAIYAQALGVAPDTIAAILEDIDTADIDPRMKPLLRYVEKLNSLPSRMSPADAEAVLADGWSEEALFEAVEVTGLFNMMNRIVEGSGVNFEYGEGAAGHTILKAGADATEDSYLKFLASLQ